MKMSKEEEEAYSTKYREKESQGEMIRKKVR